MSSSDPWSCGSRRRRSERGTLHRRPRTNYRVPHTVTCLLLGVSLAWFYKWLPLVPPDRRHPAVCTPLRDRRRDTIDRAVKVMFTSKRGLHGSPRLVHDLHVTTAGRSARRPSRTRCVARAWLRVRIKRRNGLTRQDKTAPKFPDLLRAGLHRPAAQHQVGRRHDRDPDRRRARPAGPGCTWRP